MWQVKPASATVRKQLLRSRPSSSPWRFQITTPFRAGGSVFGGGFFQFCTHTRTHFPGHARYITVIGVASEDAATLSENRGGNESRNTRQHHASTAKRYLMRKQTKSPRSAASVVALAVGSCLAWSCLPMSSAYAKQPKGCNMDPVTQSVCIYQAILADVDKTYRLRGGGGIGSVVETSTRNYKVRIFQEGRIDHLDYTVRIGAGGKVEIVDKKESTESLGPPHTQLGPPIK